MALGNLYSDAQSAANTQNNSVFSQGSAIDLAKPDVAAAELSETLQTVASNSLFTRVALTAVKLGRLTTRWVIRPFIWLPIKYTFKVVWWSFINSFPSAEESKRLRERRRRQEDNRQFNIH